MDFRNYQDQLANIQTPCYVYDLNLLNKTLDACKKARALRGGSKIYYNKEAQTETIREHRRYKQDLKLKGLIK